MDGTSGPYHHSSSPYHHSHSQSRHPQHLQYRTSFSKPAPYAPVDPYGQNKAVKLTPVMPKSEQAAEDDEWLPDASEQQQDRRSAYVKEEADTSSGHADSHSGDGSEVKTKFPVARIKRIMQADEDVGKVAQVTPVVVSKALELFMVNLVTNAAAEAKEKSSKRVNCTHLKQAVLKDNQFDFLWDIVSKVSDMPAQGEKSEDAEESKDGRKRRGGRRKRKDPDD